MEKSESDDTHSEDDGMERPGGAAGSEEMKRTGEKMGEGEET